MIPAVFALGCRPEGDATQQEPRIEMLEVAPSPLRLGRFEQASMRAVAIWSDHQRTDATADVVWSSGTPGIASVDPSGVLIANNHGTTLVSATYGPLVAAVEVDVSSAAPIGLHVDRSEVVVSTTEPATLSVTVGWSDGRSSDATGQVDWTGPTAVVGDTVAPGPTGTLLATYRSRTTSVAYRSSDDGASLAVGAATAWHQLDAYTLEYTVENPTAVDSPGFWLDLWVDDPDASADRLGPDPIWIPTLPAGALRTVVHGFTVFDDTTVGDAAAHGLVRYVDPDGRVPGVEQPLDTRLAPLVGSASAAELALAGAWVTLEPEAFWFHLEVENRGAQDARGFYVDVWTDLPREPRRGDTGDAWARVPGLEAAGRTTVDLIVPWRPEDCTTCGAWVVLDSLDDVTERDDQNTVGPFTVERRAPRGGP